MVAPGAKKPPSSRLDAAGQEALRARHEAMTLVEEQFRDFDVVWAKVHGFPWWPGVLFHSWDVVRRAGIRTDPKIVTELVVPPPEKVPELDAATGQDTGSFRLKRHCLVMFLDKFNFSLVEIDASNVASYTAHYHMYERAIMGGKSSKWNKKKTEFKRALVKAAQLLHMGNEYVEDDLVMLEEPSPAEKKQRMGEVMEFETEEGKEGSLEDAWDDPDNTYDAAFSVEEEAAVEKKHVRKSQKKTSSKKPAARKGKVAEVKEIEDGDEEVVILTPAKSRRKAPAKDSKPRVRKPSRKEVHDATHVAVVSRSPSPIDLTGTPEIEKRRPYATHNDITSGKASRKPPKPRKKKANDEVDEMKSKSTMNGRAKVLMMEDDDDVSKELVEQNGDKVSDEVADITEEEEPSNLVLTPLSSIWTTGVSDGPSAGSGVHTQLAYKQDFVWDGAVFTDELSIAEKEKAAIERKQAEDTAGPGRERSLGKRQSRSVQQSHIRQNLMAGNLDPHTMVQCAAYRPKDYVEDPNSRSRGGPTLDPPFQVVVHPDAVFVADLHAHLATCEIIGFLGGKWDEASKTLYIQAAFPCRSLVIDGDDGSTDVEMDPGSEIELRGIIENAQLEVVGWYHSHPAFAPDPSVRDIENQTSYQQLFQRPSTSKEVGAESTPSEPFVGLIVGTYDTRRSTPVSLFRYFHTRGEKVSGGARREIYMPYEFIPERRHFRSVLQDEGRRRTRSFPMYQSVLQHFKFELAAVQHQLPMDIKAPPAQRATSRSSPTRVKVQGPIRKRKQSSDGAGDKPVKKARAKRRCFARSSSAATSHIDLTEDGGNQKFRASENGSAPPKVTHEAGHNGSTDVTTRGETIASNGDAGEEEKVVTFVAPSSGGAEDNTGSSNTSAEKVIPEARNVEPQIAEVPADAVVPTEAAYGSENWCKRSRKGQNPKRINESLSSSGGDECKQLPTENGVAQSLHDSTVSQKVMQHASSKSNDAAKGLTVQVDVDTIGAPTHSSTPQSSSAPSSSAVKPGVPPPRSNSVSSRKRNRKPKKTTKNSNRSTSPSSDRPSPGMSPSPTNPPGQTFYEAFRPSGPRFANAGTHEGVTPPFSRSDGPKPDNLLVEDVQYIVVDGNMGVAVTSHSGDLSAKDKATLSAKTTKDDDHINPEIRGFMTSLVEKVVAKVVSEITADAKSSAQDRKETVSLSSSSEVANGSSDSSTNKASVNDVVKVEMGSKKPKSEVTVDADVGEIERGLIVRAGPQLFGSNGECEDIQTSLQKMASHLDKLKFSQATKPRETETKLQEDATPETKSELVVVRPEPKQDDSKIEQDHLTALRTKYGAGVSGCAEQVITLVDYYRDFERRTDLSEIWKSRITKLEKIESSLAEYVQYLNIPAALRHEFIKDLISYLRRSWATKDRRR